MTMASHGDSRKLPRRPPALGEVHVWFIEIPDASDCTTPVPGWTVLSDAERERCGRYRREVDRLLCTVGRAATRVILSRYAEVPPEQWEFTAGKYGRPEVTAPCRFRGLNFNRSHTPGLVALAVAEDRRIGIDVEDVERGPFDRRVAAHCFSTAERERLDARLPEGRDRGSLELWTLKEAYVKATGRGLGLPIREIEFDLDSAADPVARFDGSLRDDPERWNFRLLAPTTNHIAAVAAERVAAPTIIRVFRSSMDELRGR